MTASSQDTTALVGRLLLALIFVVSGIGKIFNFGGAVGMIAAKGFPLPEIVGVLTICVEAGGGLALAFGWRARYAAALLAFFTIAAALVFHNFWAAAPAQFQGQFINFMKNVAITGGMLMVVAFGPGAISVDARRR